MIRKMKLLSIISPEEDIDRVADTYLSKYEIHLENTLSEPKTVENLRPYIETNPHKDILERVSELLENYHDLITNQTDRKMKLEEAIEVINSLDTQLKELMERKNASVRQRDGLKVSRDRVVPFAGLNYNAKEIFKFCSIKFRFGRASREYYEKLSSYVYETIDTTMSECEEEGDYVWVAYFVPESLTDKIDAMCAFMHFERCLLLDEYEGTPVEAGYALDDRIKNPQKEVDKADRRIMEVMSSRKEELAAASGRVRTLPTNFDMRRMVAVTKHSTYSFYILCGWMTEKDAEMFQKEIERNSDTSCIIEDDHNNIMSISPTKVKNSGLFRSFEMYMETYGLSSYNELDPIILTDITYSILPGFMFGDARQRLRLLIGGPLLYRSKKTCLTGIISCCGALSTVFGLFFGSVFGSEDIMDAMRLRPQEAMADLLFIGRLNTVSVAVITIGMGIVLLCMILNTINNLCSHDAEKAYFDTNGVVGLVFHFVLVSVIVLHMTGNLLPAIVIPVIMPLIPLLVILFKEPLAAIAKKKAGRMETGLGMFITQDIFEFFEVLLSYFFNTLSFVRAGTSAVSHAAMIQVVLMPAGAEARGNTNWAAVAGGSLFVCGMKGLIVNIQVLCLEYYELFS